MRIQYGNKIARLAAYIVDLLILVIFYFVLKEISSSADSIAGIFGFIYFWMFTYFLGGTPGKRLFGLTVVEEETNLKAGILRLFIREIPGKIISGVVFQLGFVWILIDNKRQGWHDKIAHTVVLQEKEFKGSKKVVAYIIVFLFPVVVLIGIFAAFFLISVNPKAQIDKAQKIYELQQQMLENNSGPIQ